MMVVAATEKGYYRISQGDATAGQNRLKRYTQSQTGSSVSGERPAGVKN